MLIKYVLLFKELKVIFQNKLRFKYKDLILALMSPYDIAIDMIYKTIRGLSNYDRDIIHIICTATNSEMNDLKKAYYDSMFNKMYIKMLGILIIYLFYHFIVLVLSRI